MAYIYSFSVFIAFLMLFTATNLYAQQGLQTGLGITLEGDYSLASNSDPESNTVDFLNDLSVMSTDQIKPARLNLYRTDDFFPYLNNPNFTSGYQKNMQAFTNWRPEMSMDRRYDNNTNIAIDLTRSVFRIIRDK